MRRCKGRRGAPANGYPCRVCGAAESGYGRHVCSRCRRRIYVAREVATGKARCRSELGRAPCAICGRRAAKGDGAVCIACLIKQTPTAPMDRPAPADEREARIAYYSERASAQLPLFAPPYPGGLIGADGAVGAVC